jgi:hypothetical protein
VEDNVDNTRVSQMMFGAVVILVGLLLLAGELDLGWQFGRLWPLIFIVLGLGRFLNRDASGRGMGAWFLFLGGIFLLDTFRILSLHDSWPLFIVAAGLSLMAGRSSERKAAAPLPGSPDPPSGDRLGGGRIQS